MTDEQPQQATQAAKEEVVYITPNTPNLKFRIGEFQYEIKGGSMRIHPEDAKVLDDFLSTKKGEALRNVIKKVDYEAAAQIARQHVNIEDGRAVKGAMTTAHMDRLRADKLRASSEMAHLGSQEAIDKFADDLAHGDMALQEHVELPPTAPPAPKTSEQPPAPQFGLPHTDS